VASIAARTWRARTKIEQARARRDRRWRSPAGKSAAAVTSQRPAGGTVSAITSQPDLSSSSARSITSRSGHSIILANSRSGMARSRQGAWRVSSSKRRAAAGEMGVLSVIDFQPCSAKLLRSIATQGEAELSVVSHRWSFFTDH